MCSLPSFNALTSHFPTLRLMSQNFSSTALWATGFMDPSFAALATSSLSSLMSANTLFLCERQYSESDLESITSVTSERSSSRSCDFNAQPRSEMYRHPWIASSRGRYAARRAAVSLLCATRVPHPSRASERRVRDWFVRSVRRRATAEDVRVRVERGKVKAGKRRGWRVW